MNAEQIAQQLETIAIFKLGARFRVCFGQPVEEFADRVLIHAGAWIRALAAVRAFSQFLAATMQPSVMKAPGGRISIRKPG